MKKSTLLLLALPLLLPVAARAVDGSDVLVVRTSGGDKPSAIDEVRRIDFAGDKVNVVYRDTQAATATRVRTTTRMGTVKDRWEAVPSADSPSTFRRKERNASPASGTGASSCKARSTRKAKRASCSSAESCEAEDVEGME